MAPASETSNKAIGRRILLLCKAKKMQQKDLAAAIGEGMTAQRLNNYISGRHALPSWVAGRICAITGADFDFLHRGMMDRLPGSLIAALVKAEAADPAPKPNRKRAKR